MTTPSRVRDPAVIERIGEVLQTRGLRRMRSRIAILAILETYGHLSAAQIHRLLRVAAPNGAAVPDLATIYRTVTTLVEVGILHTVTADGGVTKYGCVGEPHHHGVCTGCGAITELSAQKLSSVLGSATEGSSFTLPAGTSLTLRGLCGHCAATGAGAETRPSIEAQQRVLDDLGQRRMNPVLTAGHFPGGQSKGHRLNQRLDER